MERDYIKKLLECCIYSDMLENSTPKEIEDKIVNEHQFRLSSTIAIFEKFLQHAKENKTKNAIIYNCNDHTLCTRIQTNGITISIAEMRKIEESCAKGPYFCFFECDPRMVYRIRGPYVAVKLFFIFDSTNQNDQNSTINHENILQLINNRECV